MSKHPILRHVDAWIVGFLVFIIGGWLIERQELPNSVYLLVIGLAVFLGYVDYKIGSEFF